MPARLVKTAARLAFLIVAIIAALWLYRGWLARGLPELQVWHTHEAENEFYHEDYPDGIDFAAYRQLETRLFAELDRVVYAGATGRYNRYNKSAEVWPGEGQRWNRSVELHAEQPRGGVLIIHGASDSPYSTRSLAKLFNDAGLYVLSLRLPGNGTIPAGLRDADLNDWLAATRMGVRHVRESIGPDLPLYLAGYSIGGALVVDYTLDSMTDATLERPARLFLYTPALGVSAAARFSSWDLLLSQFDVFEKFSWLTVEPEFDPYKFNSFAKNAGHITWQITRQLQRKFLALDQRAELPPMISFQSLVDSTISVDALVDRIYMNLADNGSELVLFDINRANDIEHFIDDTERDILDRLSTSNLSFDFTLVGNASGDSTDVVARSRTPGSEYTSSLALGLEWPNSVYSLSHVALIFPPDDPWYGSTIEPGFRLGTLAPRGENAILRAPIARFMRLRHNPFFDYLAARTLAFCPACESPD